MYVLIPPLELNKDHKKGNKHLSASVCQRAVHTCAPKYVSLTRYLELQEEEQRHDETSWNIISDVFANVEAINKIIMNMDDMSNIPKSTDLFRHFSGPTWVPPKKRTAHLQLDAASPLQLDTGTTELNLKHTKAGYLSIVN